MKELHDVPKVYQEKLGEEPEISEEELGEVPAKKIGDNSRGVGVLCISAVGLFNRFGLLKEKGKSHRLVKEIHLQSK